MRTLSAEKGFGKERICRKGHRKNGDRIESREGHSIGKAQWHSVDCKAVVLLVVATLRWSMIADCF